MKMAQKLATLVLVGSLAATGALAKGNMGPGECREQRGPAKGQMCNQGDAMPMCGKMGKRGGGMMGLDGLELTPEQFHQVQLLQAQMRVEMLESVKPLERQEARKKAFAGGKFDRKAFVDVQVNDAKVMAELKAKHMEKLYNILTPEQKEKFVQNMENRGPRR